MDSAYFGAHSTQEASSSSMLSSEVPSAASIQQQRPGASSPCMPPSSSTDSNRHRAGRRRRELRRESTADSSSGRDELFESFGRSLPGECLAWSAVEELGDVVEVFLAVDREVAALGQELSDESVPVLVGSALPG